MRSAGGRRPVKEFLDRITNKEARSKVYAALEMLGREGNRLRLPLSRSLGRGLHELRIPHPEGPFRIVYCFQPVRVALLLHGFVKRTEQTPEDDLKLARQRQPKEQPKGKKK